MAQKPPSLSTIKELQCPNCGSALSQHLANAQTLVCPACHSSISIGVGAAQTLGEGSQLGKPPKPIKPGDRATFGKADFFVLGRVDYTGWDDEDRWYWTEWLLGGADGRLAWLSYDDEDGFVMYRKIRFYEPFNVSTGIFLSTKAGKAVVTERYPAQIVGVEGELT